MSRYDITTGVLDVDAKGETGVGTVFYMDIVQGAGEDRRLLEHHVWGLLDELAGRFDPKAIAAPFRLANRQAEQDQETQRQAPQRQAQLKAVRPELQALLDAALASETQAIAQYRSGKDKALNAVVGKIIGAAKQQGLSVDPEQVALVLKAQLAVPASP